MFVADDDRAIREVLARALAQEGFGAVGVADGGEASTTARREALMPWSWT